MGRKRKKSKKNRGRKTSRGNGKRARGAGNRGGRGRAGLGKKATHKRTRLYNNPELKPSEKGFKSVKQIKGLHPTKINVGDVDKLSEKVGNEINLNEMGYDKLLGSGQVRNKLTIKIDLFSNSAKKKIENAGGEIISE